MLKCIKLFGLIFLVWNVVTASPYHSQRRQYVHDGLPEENNGHFDTSRYKFAYGVEDHKTGDFKMHQEERDGDLVRGEYTVAEADGTLRTVRYTADNLNGFNAVISKAGEARQEHLPSPAALTSSSSYHRSIKVPNHHDSNTNSYNSDAHRTQSHLPIKKYINELPQFAKLYAAKHNKIIESFAADNAAHYQSVNIDSNDDRTQYGYNLPQMPQEEKMRDESKTFTSNSKHIDVYGHQPVVFHMQTPQGFKKSEQAAHPVHEAVVEDPERERQGSAVEEPEQLNNYRNIFESHFGKYRRPSNMNKRNQGAYSYMNFEGESRNGYELQHGVQHRNKST